MGGLTQQGLVVSAAYTFRDPTLLRARVELGLGVAVLQSARAASGDVTVVVDELPLDATLGLRWAGPRAAVVVAVAGALAFTNVTASGPPIPVMTAGGQGAVVPGLGGVFEGRWSLGSAAWLFARGEALGVLAGERYLVRGVAVVDTSRFQARAAAGLGVAVW